MFEYSNSSNISMMQKGQRSRTLQVSEHLDAMTMGRRRPPSGRYGHSMVREAIGYQPPTTSKTVGVTHYMKDSQ